MLISNIIKINIWIADIYAIIGNLSVQKCVKYIQYAKHTEYTKSIYIHYNFYTENETKCL